MPERIEQQAVVSEEQHGMRFDQVAAELFPDYSRSRLQSWIRAGTLTLDEKSARPRDKVSGGAVLRR